MLSNALFMTARVSGRDPSVSEKQTNVYPSISQACLDDLEDVYDDDDLNDALDEVQAQEACNDEETSCALYYSESELRTVEDACDAANGSFYSYGAILECDGSTSYYTNFPWCAGKSCTFDEYFDSIAYSIEQNGCTLDQDSSTACAADLNELSDNDELNDTLDEVFDDAFERATCNDEQTSCRVTFSQSELRTVEDACDAANGSFYSNGISIECGNVTLTYNNYPWCLGMSCAFDEYIDYAFNNEDDGCTVMTLSSPASTGLLPKLTILNTAVLLTAYGFLTFA